MKKKIYESPQTEVYSVMAEAIMQVSGTAIRKSINGYADQSQNTDIDGGLDTGDNTYTDGGDLDAAKVNPNPWGLWEY